MHVMGETDSIEERIREALRTVIDPEVGMNVVDLGLVYGIEAGGDAVRISMTMTTPACPMSSYITEQAQEAVRKLLPAIQAVTVDLGWDPPWHPGMMSDHAKQHFGWSE